MSEGTLIPLPNKDLWRGHTREKRDETGDKRTSEAYAARKIAEEQNPLNRAILQIEQTSKGANTLTCLWCGLQGNRAFMVEHLTKNHPSVSNPAKDAEVALASVTVSEPTKVE